MNDWVCAACGQKNLAELNFCVNCGKPNFYSTEPPPANNGRVVNNSDQLTETRLNSPRETVVEAPRRKSAAPWIIGVAVACFAVLMLIAGGGAVLYKLFGERRAAANASGADSTNNNDGKYRSLTDGKTIADVEQKQVHSYKLIGANDDSAAPRNALESRVFLYRSEEVGELTVFVTRFAAPAEARRSLRDNIKNLQESNDYQISEITDYTHNSDYGPNGIKVNWAKPSINIFKQHWTNGAFLFTVIASIENKQMAKAWMENSQF